MSKTYIEIKVRARYPGFKRSSFKTQRYVFNICCVANAHKINTA